MLPPKLASFAAAIPPVVVIAAFSSWPMTTSDVLFTTSVPCVRTFFATAIPPLRTTEASVEFVAAIWLFTKIVWLKEASLVTSRLRVERWWPTYKPSLIVPFPAWTHLSAVTLLFTNTLLFTKALPPTLWLPPM